MFLSLSCSDWWNLATWAQPVELSNEEKTLLLQYEWREALFWKRTDQEAVLSLIWSGPARGRSTTT